jgi:hypothetical protein
MRIIEAGEQKLVFERSHAGERLLCTFNLSDCSVPFSASGKPLVSTGEIGEQQIGAYAAVIEEIP